MLHLIDTTTHSTPMVTSSSPPSPTLLTCLDCALQELHYLDETHLPPVCKRCLTKFKRDEAERAATMEFTPFPRLLEKHGEMTGRDDDKEGPEGNGVLAWIYGVVWGGKRGESDGDDGSERSQPVLQ
jgi:hypothetical protein